MTSPTIIQSPGALDVASEAFQRSYALFRQLAVQREQLTMERDRTASQLALQGEEAKRVRAGTEQINRQIQDLDNRLIGRRFAMANAQSDDNLFLETSQKLLDPDAVFYAHEARTQMQKDASDIAQTAAQTRNAQLQGDALQRQANVDTAVHGVLTHYQGSDIVSNPTTQARALADIMAIDEDAAFKQAQVFNQMSRNYHIEALSDGSILVADPKTGHWSISAHAWAGRPGSVTGVLNMRERLVAARQARDALLRLQAIYRIDKEGVVDPPAVTAAEDARGVVGRFLGGGAGQTTAQALRTANQQKAAALGNIFVDQYFKAIPGGNIPRSQMFIQNFRRGYIPIGPLKPGVAESMSGNRESIVKDLDNYINSLEDAVQHNGSVDPTNMPGFQNSMNDAGAVLNAVTPPGGGYGTRPWAPQ